MPPVWHVRFPAAGVDRLLADLRRTGQRLAFVHDDGTYLCPERGGEPVVRPIRGGLEAGVGDDFVELFRLPDLGPVLHEDLIFSVTPGRVHVTVADPGAPLLSLPDA